MRRHLVVLLVLVTAVPAAADVLVTTCGERIPAREVGILQNDLDCSSTPGYCLACSNGQCSEQGSCLADGDCVAPLIGCYRRVGVTLDDRARLDLNGHGIVAPGAIAVGCAGKRCAITSSVGRGEISGSSMAVAFGGKTRVQISDVDVHDCASGIGGALNEGKIEATNVTSSFNIGSGLRAGEIVATNVTANGNGRNGFSAERKGVRGTNLTADDNGWYGIVSYGRFDITGLSASGNGTSGEESTGPGLWGRSGGRLTASTVTGNVYHDAGGVTFPLDLLTRGRPKLIGTTCVRSGGHPGPGDAWGVCSGD
jgi:hypothetical protein